MHCRWPHTSPRGPYLQGKIAARLECQVQACLEQMLPIRAKWYVVGV